MEPNTHQTESEEQTNEGQDPADVLAPNQLRLDDGRVITVGRSGGKSLQNAMRIAADPQERIMVLAATSSTIDGKPLTYDEFLELDLYYVARIIDKYNNLMGNSPSQAPST